MRELHLFRSFLSLSWVEVDVAFSSQWKEGRGEESYAQHVTAWAQAATWLTFLSVSPSLDFIGIGADVDASVDVGADADVGAGVGAVGTGADAVVVGVGFGAGVARDARR